MMEYQFYEKEINDTFSEWLNLLSAEGWTLFNIQYYDGTTREYARTVWTRFHPDLLPYDEGVST